MAGQIKVDSINADSNLTLKIANTAVAFIDATGLRPTSGNVNLDATATSKLYLPSANTVAIQTAGVTAITVDASQNVGIGTSTINGRLNISGSPGSTSFQINAGGTLSGARRNWGISAEKYAAGALTIEVGASEGANPSVAVATFDSSGNLLVGTTSQNSNEKFGVVQSSSTSTVGYFNATAGDYSNVVLAVRCARGSASTEYNLIEATQVSTLQFLVRANGNVLNINNSYGSLSDVKLKENIVDATPKLADLMQVKVRNYNLKSDPTHKQLGVIAQELEQVFPAMVEEALDKDAEGKHLETTTKSVKYSVFVPMLIKAIQELKAINDTQAETINALTANFTALTARITALESTP